MGQIEILNYLKVQRESGNDCFFRIPDIANELKAHKFNIYHHINKLDNYGFLEVEVPKGQNKYSFRRRIRLKDKYI